MPGSPAPAVGWHLIVLVLPHKAEAVFLASSWKSKPGVAFTGKP